MAVAPDAAPMAVAIISFVCVDVCGWFAVCASDAESLFKKIGKRGAKNHKRKQKLEKC